MHFITSDNVTLSYLTDQKGNKGIPLLFIAGYTASKESWAPQIDFFEELGYRVFCLDKRSHGNSGNPNFGQRMSRHALDLHEWITHLDLDQPFILVGHSMGASIINAYFSLFGDNGVLAAISIDQTPSMVNREGWNKGMFNLNEHTLGTYFNNPLPNPYYKELSHQLVELTSELSLKYPFDFISTKPSLLDHAYSNWLDVLPLVQIPYLFVAGEYSPLWPKEHAIASAKLTKKGSYKIIEESGHIVPLEQPDLCNRAISSFLLDNIF